MDELEMWRPDDDLKTVYEGVEVELVSNAGALTKITYMLLRGPGGPVWWVCITILGLAWKGQLTELYFIGLVVLGIAGVIAAMSRGKHVP